MKILASLKIDEIKSLTKKDSVCLNNKAMPDQIMALPEINFVFLEECSIEQIALLPPQVIYFVPNEKTPLDVIKALNQRPKTYVVVRSIPDSHILELTNVNIYINENLSPNKIVALIRAKIKKENFVFSSKLPPQVKDDLQKVLGIQAAQAIESLHVENNSLKRKLTEAVVTPTNIDELKKLNKHLTTVAEAYLEELAETKTQLDLEKLKNKKQARILKTPQDEKSITREEKLFEEARALNMKLSSATETIKTLTSANQALEDETKKKEAELQLATAAVATLTKEKEALEVLNKKKEKRKGSYIRLQELLEEERKKCKILSNNLRESQSEAKANKEMAEGFKKLHEEAEATITTMKSSNFVVSKFFTPAAQPSLKPASATTTELEELRKQITILKDENTKFLNRAFYAEKHAENLTSRMRKLENRPAQK